VTGTAIEIVSGMHALTTRISHSANRWALDHLVHGEPLEDLVDAPFNWREGWLYRLRSR
jgi:hypothetical protein